MPAPQISLAREVGPRVAACWLLLGAGWFGAMFFGASALQQATAALAVGLPLTGGVVAIAVSRRRRLSALLREAQGLAAEADPSRPQREPGGQPVRLDEFTPLRGALSDLSRRIEAQLKEVAKKSRNLEALIDAIDDPMIATDNAGAILLCNRSAEALFAPPGADGAILGRPVRAVFTQAQVLDLLDAAKSGSVRRERVLLTTPAGLRSFQVSASPLPAAWGRGVFGAVLIMRDMTELDQAAQVKTDFVANASHELRTPVAAIRAAAETLEVAVKDDPAMATRVADMIVAHASRLDEMVRDLLDLSRLENPGARPSIEPIEPADLGAALTLLFQDPCRERGLSIACEFDGALSGMRSDRAVLMLMLRNLVENAVKFAYESTVVRLRGLPAAEPGMARFEVIDRGVGVPLNLQERVFERYFQVEPARQGVTGTRGTGLGLSIVKHAARALGGRCGLISVWREGTTAWVEVPMG